MSRSRSRTTAERRAAALLALTLAAAPAAAALPWGEPFSAGEAVRFQGTVADPQGRPLADVDVTLEASRTRLDLRSLARVPAETVTLAARSNERGEYALDWAWQPGFRRFELVASIPVRGAGGEARQELARIDLSARLKQGSPVSAALTVAEAEFVRALRAFVAALASDDERRVYDEAGRPDSVDRRDGPAGSSAAWWYFALGRVYRFRAGRLAEVERFDPVRRIGAGAGERR
jgi:hypothetical protein